MAATNKLKAVFAAIHDRAVAAGSSLRLAVEEGILEWGDNLSQAPERYWGARIEEQAEGSTHFRGSRGGLVWRYLLATASWECLLARMSLLLGRDARRVAEQMGSADSGSRRAADEQLARALTAALRAHGFHAYVMERIGNDHTLKVARPLIEGGLASRATEDGSNVIDFLVDVFVQDAELADVCNLPRYLEAGSGTKPAQWLVEVTSELDSASLGTSGFHALTDRLWEKRHGMRQAVGSVLNTHDTLRTLVLSRFLPYAECRFQVAEARRSTSLRALKESLPTSIVALDCEKWQQRNQKLHGDVIHQEAGDATLEQRICGSLAWSSVPFLYWCAKAGIDIRPLWSDEFSSVPLWPLGRHRARQEACIAIASGLDKKSFVSALRVLSSVRNDAAQATRVLITDHWDEEQATAEFQSSGARPHDRGIIVFRSDGVQRPLSAFRFPA